MELEAITDSFCRYGFNLLKDREDGEQFSAKLIIINTCTVTSMAEQKSRRLIRKSLREAGDSCVIITGCYAQLDEGTINNMEQEIFGNMADFRRLFVIPGEKKDILLDLPLFLKDAFSRINFPVDSIESSELSYNINSFLEKKIKNKASRDEDSFRYRPESFSKHTRSMIKIQDGCDRDCSYCRVKLARGKSRSRERESVKEELLSLEKAGFMEAVLTGVNICQYNDRGMLLPGLLDFLLEGSRKIRLRLSSLEPDMLDEGFFNSIKNPRIRPHFHLAIQSGSSSILKKMNRAASPSCVENVLDELRKARENPFIACDIIAGFPTETEKDFEDSYTLCEKANFAWIHVFPFSLRPGTEALKLKPRVSEKIIKERVAVLNRLAKKSRVNYVKNCIGMDLEALMEAGGRKKPGYLAAVSENYLKLLLPASDKLPAPGSLIQCHIVEPILDDKNIDAYAERLN